VAKLMAMSAAMFGTMPHPDGAVKSPWSLPQGSWPRKRGRRPRRP